MFVIRFGVNVWMSWEGYELRFSGILRKNLEVNGNMSKLNALTILVTPFAESYRHYERRIVGGCSEDSRPDVDGSWCN